MAVFEYPDARARRAFLTERGLRATLRRFARWAMWRLMGFGHEPIKFAGWDEKQVPEEVVRPAAVHRCCAQLLPQPPLPPLLR